MTTRLLTAFLLLLTALTAVAAAPAIPKLSKKERAERLRLLPEEERRWLEIWTLQMTDKERDEFIRGFWRRRSK